MSPCLFAPLIATTFQGIGGAGGRLHAVQQRLAEGHGSQCGFCTPGIGGLSDPPKIFFLFAKWYLQSCSDEHVHVAEEQAHPQHGGHRHIFPGQASPKTFSFSYIDVTLLEEPLLVNRLWANIDEKVPSVRKC